MVISLARWHSHNTADNVFLLKTEPTTVDLNENAPSGRLVEHEFIDLVLTYLERDTDDINDNLSDNNSKIPWSEHVANPDNFKVDSRKDDSKAAEDTNKYDK